MQNEEQESSAVCLQTCGSEAMGNLKRPSGNENVIHRPSLRLPSLGLGDQAFVNMIDMLWQIDLTFSSFRFGQYFTFRKKPLVMEKSF